MRKVTRVPEFGRLLARLRTRDGTLRRSREQVRRRLEALGVHISDAGLIKRYEDGRIISDPAILWGFATVYGMTPQSLLDQYVAERIRRPLAALIPEEHVVTDARDQNILHRFHQLPFSAQVEFLTWLDTRLAQIHAKRERAAAPAGNHRPRGRPKGRTKR